MLRPSTRVVAPVLLMAFVALSVSPVEADDGEMSRKTLRGIESMDVVIEKLDSEEEDAGLTVEQLQTDVELKLRLAGIKVDPDASCYLYINVMALIEKTTSARPTGNYAFEVNVGFTQMVRLHRDPSILAFAETWSVGSIANNSGNFRDHCREMVRDLVDKFVNAYLSVKEGNK